MMTSHSEQSDLSVEYRLTNSNAKVPLRATEGSAGYDLFASSIEYFSDRFEIDTGLQIHINNPNYYGQVAIRSSLARRGFYLLNSVGVIDSDYQGNIKLLVGSRNDISIPVAVGDRVAQLIFHRIAIPDFVNVQDFEKKEGGRGVNGFGSTGR